MNKVKVFSFLIIYSLIFSGCVENEKEESVTENVEKNTEQVLEYAYGSGIKEYNGETITYDSEYLEITYIFFNDGIALQTGLLVFINGIPQQYSVDNSEFENYYTFDIEEKKTKEINLKIKPNIGKTGDNLNLNFVSVLNPKTVNSLKEYRFNHMINQPMGSNLEYFIDSKNNYVEPQDLAIKEQISKDDLSRYKDEKVKPIQNALDDTVVIEVYQDDIIQKDTLNANKNIKIKIAGYSGDYVLYKVYDGIQLDPNGIFVSANKETYDTVDIGEIPKDKKNVYFLLIPVDTVHFVEQSERFMVE